MVLIHHHYQQPLTWIERKIGNKKQSGWLSRSMLVIMDIYVEFCVRVKIISIVLRSRVRMSCVCIISVVKYFVACGSPDTYILLFLNDFFITCP